MLRTSQYVQYLQAWSNAVVHCPTTWNWPSGDLRSHQKYRGGETARHVSRTELERRGMCENGSTGNGDRKPIGWTCTRSRTRRTRNTGTTVDVGKWSDTGEMGTGGQDVCVAVPAPPLNRGERKCEQECHGKTVKNHAILTANQTTFLSHFAASQLSAQSVLSDSVQCCLDYKEGQRGTLH